MFSRKAMIHTESNLTVRRNNLMFVILKMTSLNLATTTLTSSPPFFSHRCSGLLHQKTSATLSLTRISPGSLWMTPINSSSQNIELKWTEKQLQSMLFQMSRTPQLKILTWPHSGRNKNNSLTAPNKTSTIGEIDQEEKVSQKVTSTTGKPTLLKEVPMLPEMVNCVFIARSSTTHNKNVKNTCVTTSPVLIAKDNYSGQKINSSSENNNAVQNNSEPNNGVGSIFL
jgi:hypothetical protein